MTLVSTQHTDSSSKEITVEGILASGWRYEAHHEGHKIHLSLPPQRWHLLELQNYLKQNFEVVFSIALHQLGFEGEEESQETGSDNSAHKPQLDKQQAVSHLDTLQICNSLIRWCVEGSAEILDLFDHPTSGSLVNNNRKVLSPSCFSPEGSERSDYCVQDREERSEEEGQGFNTEVYTKNLLCKFVQQHAEYIVEFRNLVAHDPLSISVNECLFVLSSAKTLLQTLKPERALKTQRLIAFRHQEAEEAVEEGTLTTLAASKALEEAEEKRAVQCVKLKERVLSLGDSEAKLFIAMEMLLAIEETLVQLFRSVSELLPARVVCVSSLCALLRNEAWQSDIAKVLSVHTKPLFLKKIALVEETKQILSSGFQKSKSRRQQLQEPKRRKRYSHLDVISFARNRFNHATFDEVSREMLAQWLESAIELISAFSSAEGASHFSSFALHLTFLRNLTIDPGLLTIHLVFKAKRQDEMLAKGNQTETGKLGRGKIGSFDGVVVRMLKKPPSKAFVGREDILTRLISLATSEEQQGSKIAILQGHPGIGKSYVALKAAQQLQESSQYNVCFWITATTKDLLLSGLVSLINACGTTQAAMSMPIERIISLTAVICKEFHCLLVFDDVTLSTVDTVRELISSSSTSEGMTVLTTCVKGLEISSSSLQLDIHALAMSDCLKLLEHIILGHHLPLVMSSATKRSRMAVWEQVLAHTDVMERIVEDSLGRSPLGVRLLGQLILNEMSVPAVINRFAEEDFLRAAAAGRPKQQVHANQHSGLEITIQSLLSPMREEKHLLTLLYAISLMSPNGIPLRLLINMEDRSNVLRSAEDFRSFRDKELATLEGLGLIYVVSQEEEEGECETMTGPGTKYVMVHQLTQHALRQVLPEYFGIEPIEVCHSIVNGFSKDLRLDEFPAVRLGCILTDPKEALKWADCVLFSLLPQQILRSSQTDEDPEARSKATELLNKLIPAAHLIPDASQQHLRTIYRRLCVLGEMVQEKEYDSSVGPQSLVVDVFLYIDQSVPSSKVKNGNSLPLAGEMDAAAITALWDVCIRQGIAWEYVAYFVARLLAALAVAKPVGALVQSTEQLLSSPLVPKRADLINVLLLLQCEMVWAGIFWQGKCAQAVPMLQGLMAKLNPSEKFFESTRRMCRYYLAHAVFMLCRYDEAVSAYSAIVEEFEASGDTRYTANANRVLATALVGLGRPTEALERLKTDFAYGYGSKQQRNQPNVAQAHCTLALVYCELNELDLAEEHYLVYESIRIKLGTQLFSWNMWHMCWVYCRMGKYSEAIGLAKRRWADVGQMSHGLYGFVIARKLFPLFAFCLGPYAGLREIQTTGMLDDRELDQRLARCEIGPEVASVYTMLSRTYLWAGNYQAAWVAIVKSQRHAKLQLVPHRGGCFNEKWRFSVQCLSAAIFALHNEICLSCSVTTAGSALPASPSLSYSAQESGTAPLLPGSPKLLYSRSNDCSCPQAAKDAVNELLAKAWRECIGEAQLALQQSEVGWLFEYARVLLCVSDDHDFYKRLTLSQSPYRSCCSAPFPSSPPRPVDSLSSVKALLENENAQHENPGLMVEEEVDDEVAPSGSPSLLKACSSSIACSTVEGRCIKLRDEALNVLGSIIVAEVEKTEWTELARNLAKQYHVPRRNSFH